MTRAHFQQEVGRLERQFTKFGTERCQLLWRDVKDLSDEWFTKVIDHLIRHFRQMPVPADFDEEISKERERLWRIEKQKNAEDAKGFWEGTFPNEEIAEICLMIKKRILGQVQDADYDMFLRLLEHATILSARKRDYL